MTGACGWAAQIGDPHHRVGLPDGVLAGTATRTVGRSLDICHPGPVDCLARVAPIGMNAIRYFADTKKKSLRPGSEP